MPKKCITINECEYKLKFTREQIWAMVELIAGRIAYDYDSKKTGQPPLLLMVLTGGIFLGVDLSRALSAIGFETSVDTVGLKRFSQDEVGGIVQMISLPHAQLGGRDIIVIEDIIDQGLTMNFLHKYLLGLQMPPRSIEYCTLFLKTNHEPLDFEVKYLGCEIDPEWLVGNGMDSNQLYRGLSGIYQKI